MWFVKELEDILYEENLKIKKIEEIKKIKEREFIKKFFKINSRVEYHDRYGVKQGKVITIDDDFRIIVMVDYFDGKIKKEIEKFYPNDLMKID